jgi:hypothetical protein
MNAPAQKADSAYAPLLENLNSINDALQLDAADDEEEDAAISSCVA